MTPCLPLYEHFLPLYGRVLSLYKQVLPPYGHGLPLYGKSAPLYRKVSQLYQQFPSLYHIVAPPYGRLEGRWAGAVPLWRKVLRPFHAAFLRYGKDPVLSRMDLPPFRHSTPGCQPGARPFRVFPAFSAPASGVCDGASGLYAGSPQAWRVELTIFPLTRRVFF